MLLFSINRSQGYENPSLDIIVIELYSTGGFPLKEARELFFQIQSVISVIILISFQCYCCECSGYIVVIFPFLEFCFCSAYILYLAYYIMCKIKMKYLQLLLFTLTSYFLYFRLLGEFMLPSSNILPPTYRDLHAIMKDIGMEYQSVYACADDDIIYYRKHASKTKCSICAISRYRTDQVTNMVP
jgi:hypothetical protein